MKVVINQIITSVETCETEAAAIALRLLGLTEDVANAAVCRRSIDARHGRIQKVYSCIVESEALTEEHTKLKNVVKINMFEREILQPARREIPPIIVGFGPAGIFAALSFVRAGIAPIIVERGSEINIRAEKVKNFWEKGNLDIDTNVQFGEGGAGTFSDGKLVTRTNDVYSREILEAFVEFGADKSILIDAKPHIGTDKLRNIIKNIRNEIIGLGGKILFDTKLLDIVVKNNKLVRIVTTKGEFEARELVLATGHSARDIFELCKNREIVMEKKPFSVGFRIEHSQDFIDRALYGQFAGAKLLPKGEYQLSHRQGERGCYTFCMCPGGYVVAAASEDGGVVTNGMSQSLRDSSYANAAVVASVLPTDLEFDFLSGVDFAREIEKKAFNLGGGNYAAPAETVEHYLTGRGKLGNKKTTYARGIKESKLETLFPAFVNDMLRTGLLEFDKKYKGFSGPNAILIGAETRTSSPIRILRNSEFCSNVDGIYPAGEGAGYAGGIMSAAADGIRVAEGIMKK